MYLNIIFYYISRKAEKWRIISFYPFILLSFLSFLSFSSYFFSLTYSFTLHVWLPLSQVIIINNIINFTDWSNTPPERYHGVCPITNWFTCCSGHLEITESILPVTLIESKHFKKKKKGLSGRIGVIPELRYPNSPVQDVIIIIIIMYLNQNILINRRK